MRLKDFRGARRPARDGSSRRRAVLRPHDVDAVADLPRRVPRYHTKDDDEEDDVGRVQFSVRVQSKVRMPGSVSGFAVPGSQTSAGVASAKAVLLAYQHPGNRCAEAPQLGFELFALAIAFGHAVRVEGQNTKLHGTLDGALGTFREERSDHLGLDARETDAVDARSR